MVLRNGSTLSVDVSAAGEADEDQQPGTSQPIRVSELDQFDEEWLKPFPLKDGVRIRKEKFSDYYTLFEEIGEGKFGKVYRCEEKATGLILAAKCIKIRKDTDFEKVEKEVNIMTQMRHKCIAQIYDAFATEANDVILIMEMVQGGELFDRIADDSYILTEMAVALIMFQICEAIRYIHSQNIIHLDLKPENIMCVSQISNKIKLIDFGLAQWYDGSKDLMFMAGTPEFAAPEVIKYEPLDFHTDMWSLGVIAYILLSGQSPFLGETLAHTYCNVEKGRWRFCEEFTENGISDEAKDFISRLLIVHKEERMLPAQCLVHPWIQKNRQRALENASRAVSPAVCQPLAIEKLRSYVKNKKFRRLVFGVLFVNSVLKMLQTLQRNKSTHGIEYVRNMLAAAENQQQSGEAESSNLLLKAFTKKKQKLVALAVGIAESNQPNEVIEEKVINKKDMAEEQKMDLDKPAEKAVEKPVETRKRVVIVKKVREPGEKKKRSKSEARRAAEQQRTRSSTEHTSNKKQRQEAEEKMELEEKKKERRKSPEKEKKLLIIPREEEKKPVEVVEKPMMRIIKMEVEERQKQREANKERQRREDRERLAQFRLEADERRKAEQKEKEKPTARVGQVQKLAQRMELFEAKQKPAETQAPAAAMASTSAAPAKPANAAANSLVSNMLKRLEQQKGQQCPAPLAFAVSATAPRREEPSKKEEKREEKVEGKGTEKKEEKRTEKRAEEKRREPKKEWKEEEKGKEELISWREEIRRREQQQAADKQRGDEKKKQVKMVKRKVVRRVRTAEEEMQQVRTMKMECNGKDKRKVPEEKGMEERMEVDDNCWVSVVVVERTRERLRREAEDQQQKGQQQQQQQQQATPMVGRRKEAQINGTEQKLKVNGHQQQPLRMKPRLKVSNSLEEMARTTAHDDAGWAMVGQDVFDFSLLRMKLQNRIMGLKDNDELTTEAENRQKFELQKQKRELQTNLNIKRAMRKWLTMDKESRTTGQQGRGEPIPEWAR